jgi:hypothetical protein
VNYWLNTALTLTLSRRERGPTELFERDTPTCNTESSSSLEKHPNLLPFPKPSLRERGPTEVFERATPTCNTESNSSLEEHQNRFPSPESNSNLEKHRNRLPFPLAPLGERAGVRGKKDLQDITKPKPDLQ